MKRSPLLSALLVGLSLTTASAAFAADRDQASDAPRVQRVAQVDPGSLAGQSNGNQSNGSLLAQPTDPTTPSSNGAATAAPGSGPSTSTPGAGGAVTVGTPSTGTPGADKPATAASTTPAKPKPRPFAGSSLFVNNSMTTNTIFRGQTQYANPTVESNFSFLPRYAINDAFQVRARFSLGYEWTQSDITTYNHEPVVGDTSLQLFYRKIPAFYKIKPMISANLALPTSKASRSRTMVVSPGVTLQLVRGFEKFLGGDLALISSVSYTHPFYRSQNPEVSDARPANAFQCLGGNGCQDLLSGVGNVANIIGYSLIVTPSWGRWNPAVLYSGSTSWVYAPKDAVNPIDGSPIGRSNSQSATTMRQSHYISAWVDYTFTSWLTAEVGYWNSVSAIGSFSGQRSNLLFDRYQDTRVYLGASFQLDNLVKALQGSEEGEGGVVRAQAKPPMWTF